jgi:glucokinase-like ROK family protein
MSAAAGNGRDLVVGVDVGGSKVAVLVATRDLRVCGRHTVPTEIGPEAAAADAITDAIHAALDDAAGSLDGVAAVGVGVPGRVDPIAGTVSLAVNLGWHDLALGPQLEARLGVPVVLENDVRAAAAGLHERRVLGDVDDLAYLSVGTGISAGIVLDGRLHRGPRGLAGEIGHVVVDPDGAACPCGLRGCLETVAAGPFVARLAELALDGRAPSVLRDGGAPVTASRVFAAAASGDPLAGEVAARVGRHLARAIHQLVMTYDVEVVAVGGGVATAGGPFLDPILRALDADRAASPLADEVLRAGIVQLLPPDAEAGSWGAVVLARRAATPEEASPAGREVGET